MGHIWDPSGQPAYRLTHMGPMRNPVALPIWEAHMGPIWACLLGMGVQHGPDPYVSHIDC